MPKAAQSTASAHRRLAAAETRLPPGVTPAGTRGAILDESLRLLAERGYGATSVRDIAARVGLQPASLYAHFPSKAHVLAEIVRIGHAEHQRQLRAALAGCEAGPRAQLAALVSAHVRMHAEFAMLAVVTNAELHALPEEFAAPSLALRHQSEQLFLKIIERGRRLRVFRVADAWLAMAAIGAMGLRVAHWYAPDCGFSVAEVAKAYAGFACRLVGAEAAAPVRAPRAKVSGTPGARGRARRTTP